MPEPFRDRFEAGRILAHELRAYAGHPDLLVLALPRGGVPVAFEIAHFLRAPLDVFTVRKLGVPGQPELAMGAIATGGLAVLNRAVIDELRIPEEVIDRTIEAERQELDRRERAYRGDRPPPQIKNKTVILVDDGLATGASMRAAIAALRLREPAAIVVAVPVAAREVCQQFAREVTEIVCAITPELFYAVGLWYRDFGQVTDEEVRALLQ